ncbi:winged helix-turn-helix domain-containing protein [Streptomyces zhihengii]
MAPGIVPAPVARSEGLFDLIPPTGWTVGFLDHATADTMDEALERVRSTSAADLRGDMETWAARAGRRPVPAWTRSLGSDKRLLAELADTTAHTYRQIIAPYRRQLDTLCGADQAMRRRQLTHHGLHHLFSRLNPRCIRWRPPVLELTMASGTDGDIHLSGRGLLLIPSVFGAVYPAVDDTGDQPWLTYPVGPGETGDFLLPTDTARALGTAPDSLTALLGHTRAIVLWTIAHRPSRTTTELARLAGISSASASQHATVLRTAGLVTTLRHHNTALHSSARWVPACSAPRPDPGAPGASALRSPRRGYVHDGHDRRRRGERRHREEGPRPPVAHAGECGRRHQDVQGQLHPVFGPSTGRSRDIRVQTSPVPVTSWTTALVTM